MALTGTAARALALTVALAGCRGSATPVAPDPGIVEPTPVAVTLTPAQQAEVDRLQAKVAETESLTTAALLEAHAVPFAASLGYSPSTAANLGLIQSSELALTEAELAVLEKNGFLISDRQRFAHFGYGYSTIYATDLPVFISADSILQAVHQSYDKILQRLEEVLLSRIVGEMLTAMQTRLPGAGLAESTRHDVDLYLAVGLSLLSGAPVAGATTNLAAERDSLVAKITAASAAEELTLFGTSRWIDFSQFEPRGHYTDSEALGRYFRAMMWLGRIDMPMLQTDASTGERVFRRRSVEVAFALRSLMDDATLARWKALDATLRAFVGEPDSMSPPDVDRLAAQLGLAGYDLAGVADEALASAIVAGAYGEQKILSQVVIQEHHAGEWPIDASFLFLGQRYVFDSHVFSRVVDDRVARRMMPNPLDVAYAALANDQAAQLLAPELDQYAYAPALEAVRRLGDEHGAAFWEGNLYNLWLAALRELSPGPNVTASAPLPAVARTEPWGRRLLHTQLASWSELRHDTLLYAKQSYTTGYSCEFPDGYVDPYPAFFGRIEQLAAAGGQLVASLRAEPALGFGSGPYDLGTWLTTYFDRLGAAAATLRDIAVHEQTGLPLEPEQLAFVQRTVSIGYGCAGDGWVRGWYADLFFDNTAEFDPTIADVHTQPTDWVGNWVGRVLHVGTAAPRLMVVTIDTCVGPRAYVGVASAYREVVTENFDRLTDPRWLEQLKTSDPGDVAWVQDLVAR